MSQFLENEIIHHHLQNGKPKITTVADLYWVTRHAEGASLLTAKNIVREITAPPTLKDALLLVSDCRLATPEEIAQLVVFRLELTK